MSSESSTSKGSQKRKLESDANSQDAKKRGKQEEAASGGQVGMVGLASSFTWSPDSFRSLRRLLLPSNSFSRNCRLLRSARACSACRTACLIWNTAPDRTAALRKARLRVGFKIARNSSGLVLLHHVNLFCVVIGEKCVAP